MSNAMQSIRSKSIVMLIALSLFVLCAATSSAYVVDPQKEYAAIQREEPGSLEQALAYQSFALRFADHELAPLSYWRYLQIVNDVKTNGDMLLDAWELFTVIWPQYAEDWRVPFQCGLNIMATAKQAGATAADAYAEAVQQLTQALELAEPVWRKPWRLAAADDLPLHHAGEWGNAPVQAVISYYIGMAYQELALAGDAEEASYRRAMALQSLEHALDIVADESDPLYQAAETAAFRLRRRVAFADRELEDDMRFNAGRYRSVVDLTPADMTQMDYYRSYAGEQIKSLRGLEHSPLLEMIWIDDCDLADLEPLRHLTRLKMLFFYGDVRDISAIADLPRLEIVAGIRNAEDYSPLAKLPALKALDVENGAISDLSLLPPLPRLEWLDVANSGLTDITPLRDYTALQWLDLAQNQVADITPLADLKALTTIDLSFNNITDVSPLAALPNLTEVRLTGNPVVNAELLGHVRIINGPLMEEQHVGDYRIRVYENIDVNPTGYILEIMQGRKRVLLEYGTSYQLGMWTPDAKVRPFGIGDDLNGDRVPDLLVKVNEADVSGVSYRIFSLGTELAELGAITGVGGYGRFVDLDGAPGYEYVDYDFTFTDWKDGSFAMRRPRIILRYTDGTWQPALDLMWQPAPTAEELADIAQDIRTSSDWYYVTSDKMSTDLMYYLWGTMLDLIYSGHADLAWQFCDDAWPGGRLSYQEKYLDSFRKQLAKSPHWPALEHWSEHSDGTDLDAALLDRSRVDVVIETTKGTILAALRPDLMPTTVGKFVWLARDGYFNMQRLNLADGVVRNLTQDEYWMDYLPLVPFEAGALKDKRGVIGMIRSANSTGYQFYIMRQDTSKLPGRQPMGEVRQGFDVLDALDDDDYVTDIYFVWHKEQ